MTAQFVTKHRIAALLNLSPETLKKYRLDGRLIEGIHWIRVNPRVVRYNLPLIQDWLQNHGDPQVHQRAVENYQSTLLSNQRKASRSFPSGKKSSAA